MPCWGCGCWHRTMHDDKGHFKATIRAQHRPQSLVLSGRPPMLEGDGEHWQTIDRLEPHSVGLRRVSESKVEPGARAKPSVHLPRPSAFHTSFNLPAKVSMSRSPTKSQCYWKPGMMCLSRYIAHWDNNELFTTVRSLLTNVGVTSPFQTYSAARQSVRCICNTIGTGRS